MSERSHAASAIAGFAAPLGKVVFFPLEMLKVQLIAADGFSKNHIPSYRNPVHALMTIYRSKGFLELYRGAHLCAFNSVAWSIYFYIYEKAKVFHADRFQTQKESTRLLVASETAVLTWIITNPMWVIKTRVMLQANSTRWYGEVFEAIRKIWVVDGIRGYYAGLLPGIMLGSSEAFQMFFYEVLKERMDSQGSTGKTGVAGGLSKLFSTILVYPLQTVLVRLQQEQYSDTILKRSSEVIAGPGKERLFSGMINCFSKTYANRGFTGFYRGLTLQLLRILPSNALFFIIYEATFKYINDSVSK